MDQVCHRSEIFLGWFMNCGSTPHPGGQSQPRMTLRFEEGGPYKLRFATVIGVGGRSNLWGNSCGFKKETSIPSCGSEWRFFSTSVFRSCDMCFSVTGPCFDLWYFRFQGLECSEWGKKLNLLNVPNVMWITWWFPSSHHFHSHTLRVEMLMISSD